METLIQNLVTLEEYQYLQKHNAFTSDILKLVEFRKIMKPLLDLRYHFMLNLPLDFPVKIDPETVQQFKSNIGDAPHLQVSYQKFFTCPQCHSRLEIGDTIVFNNGRIYHLRCCPNFKIWTLGQASRAFWDNWIQLHLE